MERRYTVSVVSGTRAEFGLLAPVIRHIQKNDALSLQLCVTGAHLCPALGGTVCEIEAAGFPIAFRAPILGEDGTADIAGAVASAIMQLSAFWKVRRPDMLLLLGDRYETFAAASAAACAGIPIAHIGGGDVTQGAKDEFFRHCVSKMSALHFPICHTSALRLMRMGESPCNIYEFGSLGAENILSVEPMSEKELSESIGFDCSQSFLLCTYHPETLGGTDPKRGVRELLAAIDALNMRCVFTGSNADEGGSAINDELKAYCESRESAVFVASLGVRRYLSAMRLCAAVVGNSSSAVVETPTLKTPAVNIGIRQTGRETGRNTINCACMAMLIEQAIKKAVSPEFRASLEDMENPYGGGDTSERIVQTLVQRLQAGIPPTKTFYDGEEQSSTEVTK